MTKKFIRMIFPSLTLVLAVVGLLITSRLTNVQVPFSYAGHPILEIVGYAASNPGREFPFRLYVTPEDEVITALAAQTDGVEDAYKVAVEWIYISEQRLNNVVEKWLTPHQFLVNTPQYPSNPLKGEAVSDCEEQANSLVSLIRAEGIPAEEVRVVLGKVSFDDEVKGHAWIELLTNGRWLVLDPSSGPYWDTKVGTLTNRRGVPFNYYANLAYPVLQVDAYYNDIYYLDPGEDSGNAPDSWRTVTVLEKNPKPHKKGTD